MVLSTLMGIFAISITPLSIVASHHGDSELNDKFLCAAQRGDKQEVSDLLDAGAKIEVKRSGGYNALILSAKNGHDDVVGMLLNWRANVHQKTDFNDTALLLASGNGHTPIVRRLIDAGACLEEKDKNDKTSYELAEENGHRETAQFLQSRQNKPADIFHDHETATGECGQRLHDAFGRHYREGEGRYPEHYWDYSRKQPYRQPFGMNTGPRYYCSSSSGQHVPRTLVSAVRGLKRLVRR